MLSVVWAERAEELVDELAEVLADPVDDPFRPELVVVGSAGMRVWLRRRLAERLGAGPSGDGVAANLELPLPGALRRMVLGLNDGTGPADPWEPELVLWPTLAVLEEHAGDPLLGPATARPTGSTRVGRSRALADRFDRYAIHRPEMIRAWAAGHDVDGTGRPLGEPQRWQSELWRRVRAAVGSPDPASRLTELVDALATGEHDAGLPARITVFGLSAASPDLVDLLNALGERTPVSLLLLTPSTDLLDRVGSLSRRTPRSEDGSASSVDHPLLVSWGQPARETARIVPRVSATRRQGAPAPPSSLLGHIQGDLRAGRTPDGSHRLDPKDRSLQIHGAHGPGRQVEVLADALRHLFADDATLTEDDVVVMCPDPDRFFPLVVAMSSGEEHALGPKLRWSVADRTVRQRNPLVAAFARVLEVATGRITASELSELAGMPAVRSRFQLHDEDLELVDEWAREGHLSWGLDGDHRSRWGVPPACDQGTWRLGADRLLIGITTADDSMTVGAGGVPPLEVAEGEVRVAGAFAALIDGLELTVELLDGQHTPNDWLDRLRAIADLLCAPADGDWERAGLEELLDAVAATIPDDAASIDRSELQALLDPHLSGQSERARFSTGRITVTGLQPLRGVPHRVVCVLGLDDEAFGPAVVEGDDLVAIDPCVGDPDRRAEQRQQLLEALLSARDHLVITCTHQDVRTNEVVPEAPPLAELWSLLDATVASGEARKELQKAGLLVHHPRQATNPACFRPGALGTVGRPWSFDPTRRDAAAARGRAPATPAGTADLVIPSPTDRLGTVGLDEIHTLVDRGGPTAFGRHGLGVYVPRRDEDVEDHLPLTLDPLDRWRVGDGLLSARRRGHDAEVWLAAERRRGGLPPGDLAESDVAGLHEEVDRIAEAVARLELGGERDRTIDVALSRTRLVGRVSGVDADRHRLVAISFSRPRLGRLLRRRVDLLAVVLEEPDHDWQIVTVCRQRPDAAEDEGGLTLECEHVVGDDAGERRERAAAALDSLAALALEARTRPLPTWPRTSEALHAGDEHPLKQLTKELSQHGEQDPYTTLLLAGYEPDDLLAMEDPDDASRRWASRFAERLWSSWAGAVEEVDP